MNIDFSPLLLSSQPFLQVFQGFLYLLTFLPSTFPGFPLFPLSVNFPSFNFSRVSHLSSLCWLSFLQLFQGFRSLLTFLPTTLQSFLSLNFPSFTLLGLILYFSCNFSGLPSLEPFLLSSFVDSSLYAFLLSIFHDLLSLNIFSFVSSLLTFPPSTLQGFVSFSILWKLKRANG